MSSGWKPQLRRLEQHLTERDVEVLKDLEQFRLLSTRHVQQLRFTIKPLGQHETHLAATRATTRVLTRLESLAVITRLSRRIGGSISGSSATVWQLAPAGERYLRALRGDPDRRRFAEPSSAFVAHTLAVADVGVAVLSDGSRGEYEVLELETEPTCWRRFDGASTGLQVLKPDLLVVTADKESEIHSFVEVDRGTEHMPAVLRKCQVYQRYYRTGQEERLRGLFPAVTWIVPTEARRQTIIASIAAVSTLDTELFTVVTHDGAVEALAPSPSTQPLTPKGGTV